jgi:MFS family permease
MPALARELDASPLAMSWVLTAYLVSASVATPLIGRFGDLLGRGRTLSCVMATFCVGSVLCAVAGSLPLLIVGRLLQGVAGGVFPLAYGIIRDGFPAPVRMRAIGTLTVSLGVGAALGPAVAGVIVDRMSPSTIFWVGMVGAVPGLFAARLIRDAPARRTAPIDWPGAALLAAALATLVIALTQGPVLGWDSLVVPALFVLAILLAGWWVTIERRSAAPLVSLELLRERSVALTNGAAFFIGCGIFMAYVPLAPFAEAPSSTGYGFGLSVGAAGALLIPHGVVQILLGPWAGSLCARTGPRRALLLGAGLNAATMAAIAEVHGSVLSLLVAGAVLGIGQTLALTAMANLVVAAVSKGDVGIATGLNTVMRTVGMAVGSALSAALLTAVGDNASGFPAESYYVLNFAIAACMTAGAVVCAAGIGRRQAPAPAESSRIAAITSSA